MTSNHSCSKSSPRMYLRLLSHVQPTQRRLSALSFRSLLWSSKISRNTSHSKFRWDSFRDPSIVILATFEKNQYFPCSATVDFSPLLRMENPLLRLHNGVSLLMEKFLTCRACTIYGRPWCRSINPFMFASIKVLDDKNVRRRFRASNYQSTTRVKPFICM